MKASNPHWKDQLAGRLPPTLAEEIEIFETELELKKQEKLEDRLFNETRLRRGVYGQRYDNGKRHDGTAVQELTFPSGNLTKGPNTMWDAPGMQRIKVPFGGLNAAQLEVMAELAEEYSAAVAHVTTRQDFQLHFVHLENTPALMRRLAAVGITTREACGNSVRNVTACPYAGVCADEPFDVSPYANALAKFLLGHPDCQEFGRKFKPAFSGCKQHACGLTGMHDLGAIAVTRGANGRAQRGFELYVGGGLGAVPHHAKLLVEFLPPEELLPTAQAIARVFARLGEKKNRNRARLKFLINDIGIDAFRKLVREEREQLPHDPQWVELIREAEGFTEQPLHPPGELPAGAAENDPRFAYWLQTNTRPQSQDGYVVATVTLPLGDITSAQLRGLADIVRTYTRDTIRTTVEQNFVLRWISRADLPALYADLRHAGLAQPGAGGIVDIVACPGTDTCKLGISASRGLAGELRKRLEETSYGMDEAIRNLHIKVSGCFNSCGQHHVADLGFYGVSRKLGGRQVPHFQVILGGEWTRNAGSFGLPIVAIPSKHIPEVVTRITNTYLAEKQAGESFQDFAKRIGKAAIKALLADLVGLPGEQPPPDFFVDWGDSRPYGTADIGVGECAGEVVTAVEFGLASAERSVFEAQLALEKGLSRDAATGARQAMLRAAASLLRIETEAVPEDSDAVVSEFRTRFYETQKFFDPYAGGKFANYLFAAVKRNPEQYDEEGAHHLIEEAQLFIESAHRCFNRLSA